MKTGQVSRWSDERRVRLDVRELLGALVLAISGAAFWIYLGVMYGGRFSW